MGLGTPGGWWDVTVALISPSAAGTSKEMLLRDYSKAGRWEGRISIARKAFLGFI